MSYSISRDTPTINLRIRNRKQPPTTAIPSNNAPYRPSFPRVTPTVRSSMAYLSTHGDKSETEVIATTHDKPSSNRRRCRRT